MYHEFMLMFYKDMDFMGNVYSVCHNFSFYAPANLEEAKKFSVEDFLEAILIQVGTWKHTLQYLVTELRAMPGAPNEILSRAQGIEAENRELLEVIRLVAMKVDPGIEENDYSVYTEISYLQEVDEESQFFAVFKLYDCLGVDTYSLELYLKFLRCRLIPDKICNSLGLRDGI
ncbi:prolactin-7C1-like [Nannospalax galili]|uniref:prolactin-7C1-like n=1 Tax=Nannospalax galili TaxID=1026970 RepID=UPI000819FD62|nr:prolactin-7C1-like [Nannospalax galili]